MWHVLIADDEPYELLMLQSMFSRLFPNTFEVMTAENGRQAIVFAKEFEPDIIILDIEMPGINGLEAARQIRADLPQGILFFLTAHEVFTYAQQACDVGASGYLLKPISDEVLLQSVKKALEQLTEQKHSQHNHHLAEQQLLSLLLSGSIADDLLYLFPEQYPQAIPTGTIAIIDGLDVRDADIFSSTLRSELPSHFCYVFSEYNGVHLIWFVLHDASEVKQILTCPLKAAARAVAACFSPEIRITVGKPFRDLAKVHDAFSSAYLARYTGRERKVLWFCEQDEDGIGMCELIHRSLLTEGASAALSRFRVFCRYIDAVSLLQQLLLYLEAQAVQDLGRSFVLRLPEDLKYRDVSGITAWAEHCLLKYRTCYEETVEKNRSFGVLAIRQYIRDHYASDISLAEVAAAMNYSEAHFSRLFSQYFGKSFTAYLTEVRMQTAQSLLIATNRSINRIGEAVGYRNPNYFAKAFRKVTGLSPSEFRSNHQGKGDELP